MYFMAWPPVRSWSETTTRPIVARGDRKSTPLLHVVKEDVALAVRVVEHEVRGVGFEGHEAPVGGDRGSSAGAADGLSTRRVDGHPRRAPGPDVAKEDVAHAVAVLGHKVRGVRVEGHEAAIAGGRGVEARAVGLSARGVDGHPRRAPGHDIVEEDVPPTVEVRGHEV